MTKSKPKRISRPDGYGNPTKRSDGRWIVPYRIEPNRWHQIPIPRREAVSNESEAIAWAVGYVSEGRVGSRLSQASSTERGPTISDLYCDWLSLREGDPEVSGATLRGNRSHFRNHIVPEFGDVDVTTLCSPMMGKRLGEWIRMLKSTRGKQTVNNVFATLKLFFDFLESPEGGSRIVANPLRQNWALRLLPRRKKSDVRFSTIAGAPISMETAQALISNCHVPLLRRARYAVAFTSPLRDGELSGLRLRDINLIAPIPFLDVRQACVLSHRDGFAVPGPPKNEWALRRLPLHPCAVDLIRQVLHGGWHEYVCRSPSDDDPLFPREDGQYARPDSAEYLRSDLDLSGQSSSVAGTPLRFHDIRGCVATWMLEKGVRDSLIRRFLGHAPQGAAEGRYFKGDLLAPLAEAQRLIELRSTDSDQVDRSAESQPVDD